jgi:nicotinamidase/pyrazinamidase
MNGYDRQTALLVVDVQNDFADPAGSLYVQNAEEIFPVVNRELARAEYAAGLVAYTQDWHPETTPHFKKDGGIWPVHCVKGSWGAQLSPSLYRVEGAAVIRKGQNGEDGYSGFSYRDPVTGRIGKTELEDALRRRGIRRVVVAGLATDYCVKETALDALAAGFETVVLRDGVRAVELRPRDGERALAEIARRGGRVTTADEFDVLAGEAQDPISAPE